MSEEKKVICPFCGCHAIQEGTFVYCFCVPNKGLVYYPPSMPFSSPFIKSREERTCEIQTILAETAAKIVKDNPQRFPDPKSVIYKFYMRGYESKLWRPATGAKFDNYENAKPTYDLLVVENLDQKY